MVSHIPLRKSEAFPYKKQKLYQKVSEALLHANGTCMQREACGVVYRDAVLADCVWGGYD